MEYKGKQLDLQSGDVILYRTGFVWTHPITYLSAAIRFFTGVEYNHAAVVVSSWGVPMINEAIGKGIIQRPLAEHLERHKSKIFVLRPTAPLEESAFCIHANSALGRSYDTTALVFHHLWYRLTKRWTGSTREKAEKKMVCSEYVAWCHRLENWWLYSSAELLVSKGFTPYYIES